MFIFMALLLLVVFIFVIGGRRCVWAHRYRQLAANIQLKLKAREVQRASEQGDHGLRGGNTAHDE
jgi:hypothetical protein